MANGPHTFGHIKLISVDHGGLCICMTPYLARMDPISWFYGYTPFLSKIKNFVEILWPKQNPPPIYQNVYVCLWWSHLVENRFNFVRSNRLAPIVLSAQPSWKLKERIPLSRAMWRRKPGNILNQSNLREQSLWYLQRSVVGVEGSCSRKISIRCTPQTMHTTNNRSRSLK